MNHSPYSIALLTLTLLGSCAAPDQQVTRQDSRGNYATSSTFNAAQRVEFETAMRAGLADFDRRRTDLEARASKLGQTAVEEYHAHGGTLAERRTALVNELARLTAALDSEWPDRRSDTQEAYDEMREALDAAYAEVLS